MTVFKFWTFSMQLMQLTTLSITGKLGKTTASDPIIIASSLSYTWLLIVPSLKNFWIVHYYPFEVNYLKFLIERVRRRSQHNRVSTLYLLGEKGCGFNWYLLQSAPLPTPLPPLPHAEFKNLYLILLANDPLILSKSFWR